MMTLQRICLNFSVSLCDRMRLYNEKLNMQAEQRNDAWENAAETKGREWLNWHWSM